MKRILIAGANSYIGTSFENYIKEKFHSDYTIDTVDMISDAWKESSFAGYDSIFCVAGIAHSDNGKISAEKAALYYSVNRDLAIETAKKAKDEGLTPAEQEEQKALRAEYIAEFRAQFGQVLSNTVVQYPDGSRKSLDEIKDEKNNEKK